MGRTRVRWRAGALAVVTTAVGGVFAGRAVASDPTARPDVPHPHVYVVLPGDTLWEVARQAVGPEGDPRPMVDALVGANGLAGGTIVPGQRLVVPGEG